MIEPCQNCPLLGKEEIKAIEGKGPIDAPLFIVGMNPGRVEVQKGAIFVGDSGLLLDEILTSLNLLGKPRISNAVKCFTYTVTDRFIAACRKQIITEIDQVNPKVIVLLGKNAVKSILPEQGKERQNALRNRLFYYKSIPVVVTYHPSFILRQGGKVSPTYTHLKDDIAWASSIAYGQVEIKDDPVNYRVLTSKEEVLCLLDSLVGKEMVAVDFETSSKLSKTLWKEDSKPMTISFSPEPGEAYGFGLEHPESPFKGDREWFKQVLGDYLPRISLTSHNASFEDVVFHRYYNKEINCKEDTLLMYALYNPYIKHDLHSFIANYTHVQNHKLGYLQYPTVENNQVPLQTLLEANLADVDGTIRAYHKLRMELEEDEWSFYKTYQMGMFHPVAVQMIENGMKLETEYIRHVVPHYLLLENKLLDMGQEILGINMNSPDQLSGFMLDLGLILPHTDSGGHSTNKEALAKTRKYAPKSKHHVVEFVELFKEYSYMNKYYINKLFYQIGDDGRVHPSWKIFGARSGRSSCSGPNLQNVSKNKDIQKMFTSEGWLVSFDYKTHELRYFAMLMSDWDLIQDFKKGMDPHTKNASLIFNKQVDLVTPDERFKAKSMVFGRLYGAGAARLADQLGISLARSKELIATYDREVPSIKRYYDWVNHEFNEKQYFESPFGKRWKDLTGLNFSEKVNYPIQGGANYVVWWAAYKTMKAGYKIISQVHDSILWEFNHYPTAKEIVELYQICTSLEVPGYEKESRGLWDGEFSMGQNLGYMVKI